MVFNLAIHKSRSRVWLALLLAPLSFTSIHTLAQSTPAIRVETVSVHLLLSPSGVITPDVLAMKDFGSWNFIPLSKDLPNDQRFYEFLIKVRLAADSETYRRGKFGEVELRSKGREKVLARFPLDRVYIGPEREAVTFFLVRNHVCEPLVLTVNVGKARLIRELPFSCGE